MTKKAEEHTIEKEFGYLKIDGEYYELKGSDGHPEFKKVDSEKIRDRIAKAKRIAKKLKDHLDR